MRFLQVGGPAISSHCYPTFRTVLPRACPVSLSSWARRASESGSTVSSTGFSFPASTSFVSILCRRLSNNRNQNPPLFQHLPRAVLGIAAQRVEHHVHIMDNILE